MQRTFGEYRNVYWHQHHWGLELSYWPTDNYQVTRNYVGNGTDRVTVRESVADFLSTFK
jgi:hypothetical protein